MERKEGERIRILMLEDQIIHVQLLQQILSLAGPSQFELVHVETLDEALNHLSQDPFDVVLLDLNVPDSRGIDTFLRTREHEPAVPIIILTADDDETLALKTIQQGAQDYLIKGQINVNLLVRSIRYAIERQQMQSELRNLSLTDELTGLYNRRGFLTLSRQQIKLARRTGRGFFLIFLDLDSLKFVNDNFGHQEGDRALFRTAEIFRQTFRRSDIIARWGGDEFIVLIINAAQGAVESIKRRLQTNFNEGKIGEELGYSLTLSIGIAYFDPSNPVSMDELMAEADEALYEDKRNKRDA